MSTNSRFRRIIAAFIAVLAVSPSFVNQAATATTNAVALKSSWAIGRGETGQRLRVWKPATLSSATSSVRIVGSGYDETVGIYVGMCVVPKSGALPTPCGGGVDKGGTSRASVWVSSNPPPYGIGLAVPFGIDGKFDVKITVGPRIGKYDCRKVRCAITTRADHTNTSFRGADVFVPLTFAKK